VAVIQVSANRGVSKGVLLLTQPLVSVIIVNWNGKHLLGECLDSLVAQTMTGIEIVLVDNGSQDGSADYVQERYSTVRVVRLTENLGYAGGNNAGIRISQGKYIALLNNDTKADPAWLENLLSEAESSSRAIGMWASKILSYDNPDILDNVGLLIYPDGLGRGKGRLEPDNGQYDKPEEALFPSGCAGLYRADMVAKIGLFDEEFFAYADDVDLGLRARLAGWGCTYVPTAKVYHKYSMSSSAYSPFKAFLVERNRIWVLLKYFPLELILLSPFFTLLRLIIHLYGAATGRGASGKFSEQHSVFKALSILLKAWTAVFLSLPDITRRRLANSRLRRIGRIDFYRLLCKFRISAREVALKE
jgi:GT2 family glycosyltransferase